MRRLPAPLLACTIATAITLIPLRPAWAYVRTETQQSRVPVRWLTSTIILTADLRGTRDLSLAEIEQTLGRSTDTWSRGIAPCSSLRLGVEPSHAILEVARDRRPVVVFRNREWRRPGMEAPYDPATLAITTLFYVNTPGQPGDGAIIDADIEVNAVNHTLTLDPATSTARPGTELADLENTLTHELGHVQGLAHTCLPDDFGAIVRDNLGRPVPACDSGDVPADIAATTMYPTATAGETDKRTLEPDDIQGVCDTYPIGPPVPQYGQLEGGCATSGRAAAGAKATLILALFAALLARRRAGVWPRRR